jgi:hypothetical protein
MTRRDRYVLIVIAIVGLLGAYWFMALTPKREKLSKVSKDLTEAKQTLQVSQQEKVKFAQAQVQFPTLYASLGKLGKAVPTDEDVPSLLVQLNHAAAKANVDFRSVALKLEDTGAAASATASTPAAGTTPPATGATGATGAQGATATASSTAGTATGGATGAAAGGATTAATGTLQPLPFEYKFKGDYFHLENVIHNVTRLVESRNNEIAISGRLVVIEAFSMSRGKVTILAKTYMLPADQGLFGGATAAGPVGATAATPQPASSTGAATPVPPSAAVTP